MDKNTLSEFFHQLAPSVITLVENNIGEASTIVTDKGQAGNYATKVDVDTENFVVSEIQKSFPGDEILAEEGYSDTEIPAGRIWLIDPICGTNNLGKGINNFCTNIALVDNGIVIAACVVDHSLGEYIWSIGDQIVYVGKNAPQSPAAELGTKIDVDFGSVKSRFDEEDFQAKHNNFTRKLMAETDFDIISMNTSLGFAYTAIGKTDGFLNVFNHPWDIAAAGFLIQQAGGVITGIDGSPWTVSTVGAIGGRTPEIHQKLLDLFLNS